MIWAGRIKCYDIDEPSPMETPNIDALAKKSNFGKRMPAPPVPPAVVPS